MIRKILLTAAVAIGAVSTIAASPVEAAGCATQTIVYFRDPVPCTLGTGDYVIRVLPKSYGILDALNFAPKYGGGRVIAWGNGLAVVVYR